MYFIRSYGRRKNRQQKEISSDFLVKNLPSLDFKNYHLEIGFGNGEMLLNNSILNKEICYLGVDVYKNGINKVLKGIEKNQLKNLYIYEMDVRELLEKISEKFFSQIYIFFPDPWPKKKQKKRRLINESFAKILDKKLKISGKILFSSDHKDYFEDVLNIFKEYNYQINYIFRCLGKDAPFVLSRYGEKAQKKEILCNYFMGTKTC
ncbi:tRNA (guanosine(46)-N7)-methyltransferase TrmB [Rickettsiales bacterium (ex Bugula neritina AB1)]|nr:tRNA (guanosine(46)-N7)-methyltransferase TrmB [Rickettsiales bacterium (ex Bugula neritina AB1)]